MGLNVKKKRQQDIVVFLICPEENLIGDSLQVLKNIDMIGNDLVFGIGTCGKDGQGVPVYYAQPTLRVPE
jgi:predicted Zn-dependent protease